MYFDGHGYPVIKVNTMINNIGCSCHLVRNGKCLEDVESMSEANSSIGEGQMLAVKKGRMHCAFKGANGMSVQRTLYPVKVVQGLR